MTLSYYTLPRRLQLKTTHIILQCLSVRCLGAAQLNPLQSFTGASQAVFLSGAWSPLLNSCGYWQNSVPFTCRAEVPIFLVGCHQDLISAPRGYLSFWSQGGLLFKAGRRLFSLLTQSLIMEHIIRVAIPSPLLCKVTCSQKHAHILPGLNAIGGHLTVCSPQHFYQSLKLERTTSYSLSFQVHCKESSSLVLSLVFMIAQQR